jgi:hypothetical protein
LIAKNANANSIKRHAHCYSQDGAQVVVDLGRAVPEAVVGVQVPLVQLVQNLTHSLNTDKIPFIESSIESLVTK